MLCELKTLQMKYRKVWKSIENFHIEYVQDAKCLIMNANLMSAFNE